MIKCPYTEMEMSIEVIGSDITEETMNKIAIDLQEIAPKGDANETIAKYHNITSLELANSPNMQKLRTIYFEHNLHQILEVYKKYMSDKLAWYMLLVQFAPDKLELK